MASCNSLNAMPMKRSASPPMSGVHLLIPEILERLADVAREADSHRRSGAVPRSGGRDSRAHGGGPLQGFRRGP